MDKLLMGYSEELKEICTNFCLFLKHNDLKTKKILDYVMELIKFYEINDVYFRKFEFNNNLKSNGVYVPEDKKIILNLTYGQFLNFKKTGITLKLYLLSFTA